MASTEPSAIRIEFESRAALEKDFEQNLRNGGAMARGAIEAVEGEVRKVEIVHPDDGRALTLVGRVVWVGEQGGARVVGLAFVDFGPDMRKELAGFVGEHKAPPAEDKSPPESMYDRLRGLSTAEQMKMARDGEVTERMALERIYGKGVWEPLLRNPRLTLPEVARIAHMGSLPVPLVDLIVSNGAWLANSTVRRALLGNPRLGGDAVTKVLRAMPQGELRLIPKQTAYSMQVREAARRLLRA
ncbi:MAG: PilZ domain-containing protein [Deltaproteobacteria bacterium]|nr:PilZ domain-containing protein [Deltaproteobacteria bacterium]